MPVRNLQKGVGRDNIYTHDIAPLLLQFTSSMSILKVP